jgi:transcription-repair coupling factor (superfamily II helicase)
VNVDLPYSAFVPRDYVTSQRLRIEVYRRLARIRRPDRLEDFQQELRDRFGAPPEPVEWLLRLAELRVLAARWQVATIHLENRDVVLGYRSARLIQRLANRSNGRLRVVDDRSAYFRLKPAETEPLALHATLKTLLRLAKVSV